MRSYISPGTLSKLLRVKISQEDVGKLLLAEQTHNQRAMLRAMTKYAAAWKALNPSAKAAVHAVLNSKQEGAVAVFGQFSSPATWPRQLEVFSRVKVHVPRFHP